MSESLRQFLLTEAEKPFIGWDFSYLDERMASEPLHWSYPSIILPKIRRVKSLLDLGTGGGEKLARWAPLPLFTCATEGYGPNIPIAKKRLEPLGVQVFPLKDESSLPFAAQQFELVINRHESYSPKEVFRILQNGGTFVTQQVGAEDSTDINRMLDVPVESEWETWHLEYAVDELQEVGFEIVKAKECFPVTRIFDVGALVYYLKAIPWQIPDFSVEKFFDRLVEVDERIQMNGFVEVKSHRFLIEARKSGSTN